MRRIGCLVIIGQMTAGTSIRRAVVISVMTYCTVVGDRNMSSCKHIIIVMDRESCRLPARIGCMTGCTGSRYTDRCMIRIGGLVIGRCMAG